MQFDLKDLDSERVIRLKSGDTVGRGDSTHRFTETTKLSRTHFQFSIEGDNLFILDLNSRNGTFVNSKRIESNKKFKLENGSIIIAGDKKFICNFINSNPSTSSKILTTPSNPKISSDPTASNISRPNPLPPKTYHFSFKASDSELLLMMIKNIIFIILTFGFYIPYARTNIRKFIWKSTSLNSTPFLFKGDPSSSLKAYGVLLLIMIGMNVINTGISTYVVRGNLLLSIVHSLLTSAGLFIFFIWARYGAYSYLVNNTTYRSVSFNVKKGGSKEHLSASILGSILTVFSFGIYYPFMASNLDKIRWGKTHFGTSGFKYDPDSKEFAITWIKGILMTLFTLGIYYPWFAVSIHQYKMSHLKFGLAKFSSSAKGSEYLMICIKSFLLLIVTLGIAAPFVFNLNLAYFLEHTSIKGTINFDEIVEAAKVKHKGSFIETAADVLDLDPDIGIP